MTIRVFQQALRSADAYTLWTFNPQSPLTRGASRTARPAAEAASPGPADWVREKADHDQLGRG